MCWMPDFEIFLAYKVCIIDNEFMAVRFHAFVLILVKDKDVHALFSD